ncbi:MAG: transketolase [Candidatus Bipolaricaulia bacterium]
MPEQEIEALKKKAYRLRRDVVEMVYRARSGHPGGALGMADVLTVLWYKFLRDDPQTPRWPERDRFILSNGHTCPILYAILADKGYFPREELWRLRKLGALLQGHPSTVSGTPGVEFSSGSLGIGLSFACGVALAGKLDRKYYRVFCSISDAECQEGQTWEAALTARHYRLDNLIAILDRNGSQIDGPTEEIMGIDPLAEKWRACGWHTFEIDGHDYGQIIEAFEEALQVEEKPKVIICHNVIGRGVSFMEGDYHWHHGAPTEEQFAQAMEELTSAGRENR